MGMSLSKEVMRLIACMIASMRCTRRRNQGWNECGPREQWPAGLRWKQVCMSGFNFTHADVHGKGVSLYVTYH